jgi:hypothetical protein
MRPDKKPDRNLGDKGERDNTKRSRVEDSTPATTSLPQVIAGDCCDPSEVNSAVMRDLVRQEMPAKAGRYNQTTDQGLASRRSKHILRSNDEVEASISGDLPAGEGLSLRAPMAGQCENDQFMWCTDRFGKQRS